MSAQPPKNVLSSGSFEALDNTGKPIGWTGFSPNAKVVRETRTNGAINHYVVVAPNSPQHAPVISYKLPLQPEWKSLEISARMKAVGVKLGAQSWQSPRVALEFLGKDGKNVGYPGGPRFSEDSDWKTLSHRFDMPANAATLLIQVAVFGPMGELSVDDIQVVAFQGTQTVTPAAPVAVASIAADAPWPSSAQVRWGAEPVDVQSSKRARVNLNGAWKFSPPQSAGGQANVAPEKGWGYMAVPGNWRRHQEMIAKGTGPQWASYNGATIAGDGKTLSGAWYERRFKVPADWNGRHISIDFQRISTDATFWINDKPAGKVNWPEGELDITNLVKAGEEVTLRAFVVATVEPGDVLVMMGDAPGQNWTAKRELQSAGIVGNVTLQSRPRGAHVSDVYIQPSTRKKQLGVDVEFSGLKQNGPVQLVARLVDENGKEEKRFIQTVNATAGATQRVKVAWAWPNPRLWDYKQPNLYTLRLSAKGAGLDDEPVATFGFRETWIEGRHVFLNGTPFRMRPFLLGSGAMGAGNTLAEALELGYNFGELWPESIEDRSSAIRFTDWFDVTDRGGMPISGIMPHMGWMGNNINSPAKVAAYRAATERIMRRYRNHPSIIMWGTSGNMMGAWRDPAYIGTIEASRRVEVARGTPTSTAIPLGELGVSIIKSFDPTRPVFIHNGGSAGDIYTLNNYLNFIPLQEREEWLSNYVVNGQMPLTFVEFGTPVNISLMRGRNGFQNAYQSENWLTEFASIYLGNEAYKLEPAAYRKKSAELFIKDQTHAWSQSMPERDYSPSWMQLQDLFIRNTWRSWRTMGMTGGMVPWDRGYARLDGKLTAAGEALRANNSDTLAWIVGAAQTGDVAAFTAKDHSYFVGEAVRKQIALLNDSRKVQKYSVRWTATLDGKPVANGTKSGDLAVGKTLFVPFEFAAPTVTNKTGGAITMDATIGAVKHTDRFEFRVWPRAIASTGTISVFDPEGKTSTMLRALGYTVAPWNGQASTQLLVIGRNALKTGGKLPGDLKAFVQNGGRVLLSGHDPHWLREYLGMRVSQYQSRRMWKVGDNAAVQGLDELDLRDWRGHSTLLNPRPDYVNGTGPDVRAGKTTYPYAGWRWGNRGTVASAALEKPHRSGWTPLIEGEFDLAYSPLMELDYGRGKVLWSQLDLEDHATLDPAAQRLARQVVGYATTSPLAPRVTTTYIGGEAGSALLNSLGVQFKSATALPTSGLLIVGADATISNAQLETFARGGGKVLFLPRRNAAGAAGLQLQQTTDFIGSLQAPDWAEARGLSASDLRWRNAGTAWLAASGNGWQIGADGLLARRAVGNGVMLASQIDPTLLPADEKTYFRFTRWRQTRALSQVLANLGASFTADEQFFSPRAEEKPVVVAVAGEWRAKQIQRLAAAPSPDKGHADPGISQEARRAVAADFNDAAWQTVQVPRDMDTYGDTWKDADGEAVLRKVIEVPAALVGQDLKLSLASIDDHDDTYFNGVRIGGVGKENSAAYSVQREYSIPANLVKPGKNVIAVRVWDKFGGGGIASNRPEALMLQSARIQQVKTATLYHPDYRDDFELGDEPYRYYNW